MKGSDYPEERKPARGGRQLKWNRMNVADPPEHQATGKQGKVCQVRNSKFPQVHHNDHGQDPQQDHRKTGLQAG